MKKRVILTMMLIAMVLCTLLQPIAFAATSGTCGENATWKLENGVLTISGTGDMRDYKGFADAEGEEDDLPEWRELTFNEVVVEEGITSIGAMAFWSSFSDIEKITLPSTLTKIMNHAFTSTYIEELIIPDNVKTIGYYAFTESARNITIGRSVEKLEGALEHKIGSYESITVSEENPYYMSENGCLFNKDKTRLIKCTEANNDTIYTVPSTVKIIDDSAFMRHHSIETIIIPDGVTEIGYCGILTGGIMQKMQIPKSVTKMDYYNVLGMPHQHIEYMGTEEEFRKIQLVDSSWSYEEYDENGIATYTKEPVEWPVEIMTVVFNPVIEVLINNTKVSFDVYPQIINDRTMVPVRAIFEALGANVEWNAETRTVTAIKDDTTVSLTIDNKQMLVNDKKVVLDSPAVIVDNRTLVPVRAISEAFGCDVNWNGEARQVLITK